MSNNYGRLQILKRDDPVTADRCAKRLLRMRQELRSLVNRKSDSSLLLATWNIRDFGSAKFGFGPTPAGDVLLHCRDHLLLRSRGRAGSESRSRRPAGRHGILGREWDFIATDTTEGRGGNDERMAFLYNTEKVWFRKIAGEIVLPDGQLIVSPKKVKPPKSQPKPGGCDRRRRTAPRQRS